MMVWMTCRSHRPSDIKDLAARPFTTISCALCGILNAA